MRASNSLRLGLAAALALVAVWPQALATAGEQTAEGDYGAAAAGCDVTEATSEMAPGATAPSWQIERDGLAMPMGELSTLAAVPRNEPAAPGTYPGHLKDGRIEAKIPWFRERIARGKLRVKVRSVPGRERAKADYTNHLGPDSGVIPGGMSFPREGCWRVVGRSGDNTLRATIWVVSLTD
jgi:hypothetical protein